MIVLAYTVTQQYRRPRSAFYIESSSLSH